MLHFLCPVSVSGLILADFLKNSLKCRGFVLKLSLVYMYTGQKYLKLSMHVFFMPLVRNPTNSLKIEL